MEKHRFDKDGIQEVTFNLDAEDSQPTAAESEDSARKPKNTEQVEVINWSRDTTPQVVVTEFPKTERPETASSVEVEVLNKDDEAHNKSSEEDETITTVQPTADASIEFTTVLVPTRQTTEDDTSMFDEVKKSLSELFGMTEDDDEPADQLALEDHEDREQKSLEEEESIGNDEVEIDSTTIVPTVESEVTSTVKPAQVEVTTTDKETKEEQSSTEAATQSQTTTEKPGANPMGSLILATSTSRQVSHETEICYRGRCIKTDKKKHGN